MDLMTILAIVAALAAALLMIILAVAVTRLRDMERHHARAQNDLEVERANLTEARDISIERLREKTEAETLSSQTEILARDLRTEALNARSERDSARNERSDSDKNLALANQELENIKREMSDWEKTKAQTIEAAKAAALASTREMSSKLLEDHKRESQAAKEEVEKRVKKTTEDLNTKFNDVVKVVASLADQVEANRKAADTLWSALSSPGGAGQFAEIGLENTLKQFGLTQGRDFFMQQTIYDGAENSKLRPDAVVFLPGQSVLVIDSKASKFLLDLAEAEGSEQEDHVYKDLARTMNQHLKGLSGRNYKNAILEGYKNAGRDGELRGVFTVMYLPNDGALEKLRRADPSFAQKASKAQIILSGPEGLAGLIAVASQQIDLGKQAENQEKIIESIQRLLESLATCLGHVEKVGRGIRSAADNFAGLTGSINSRLLPRARSLISLGVKPVRHETLEQRLPAYKVMILEENVIEGEAEEVEANVNAPVPKALSKD